MSRRARVQERTTENGSRLLSAPAQARGQELDSVTV
jgi:hypothetical protein